MNERELFSMESRPAEVIEKLLLGYLRAQKSSGVSSISSITDQRKAEMLHVNSDLVRSSGF